MPPPAESQAVDSLYREHHGWLISWLCQKLGCRHSAEDTAHDTFIRILKCGDLFRNVENPRAYLRTTAKNLIVDRARREVIEQTYIKELAFKMEVEGVTTSPEQILEAVQALEQISIVLERVSKKAQQAFLMYYLEGLTQAAISIKLNVTSRTVRSYLVQVLMNCQTITEESLQ